MEWGKQRFHLILVHGIGDDKSRQRKVWNFWNKRFRDTALVTSFPFVDENSFSPYEKEPSLPTGLDQEPSPEREKTINFGSLGFAGRAQALLDRIIKADAKAGANPNETGDAGNQFVYIFLSHDLGGSLVQQALDLASHHRRYLHIANATAGFVNCEPASGIHVSDVADREDEILRFASIRHPDSRLPFGVLRDLPCDLESIAWTFEGMKRHYVTLDVTSEEGYDTTFRAGQEVSRERYVVLSNAKLNLDVWKAEPGHAIAEQIFDFIKRIFVTESWQISKEYRNFLALLSRVSPTSRQLRLSRPAPNTLGWVTSHPSYTEWMAQGAGEPDILYLSGPRGSGKSVVASHLVAALQEVPNSTVISFAFSHEDQRTQPMSAFYISLIRQVLFTRPLLYKMISSVAGWVKNEDVFGYEILTGMLLTLLKGSFPSPVFCVVYGVEDCKEYNFDDIVSVIRRFRTMMDGKGTFKLVVSDEHPRTGLFKAEGRNCRDIDLSDPALCASDVKNFVQSKINKLAIRHPEWEGYEQHIVESLGNNGATFLSASFSTRLLETARIPSTIRGVKTMVESLPWTTDKMYDLAFERCEPAVRAPLTPLLQWVLYSVRPLSLNELAVVPGLATPGDLTWEDLKLDTHLRLAGDIRPLKGSLVRPAGLQVHAIHSSMEPALAKIWRKGGQDPEMAVFTQCLKYLELAFQHLPDIAVTNPQSPTDLVPSGKGDNWRVFALLGYGVTHWSYHYRRVRDRLDDSSKDWVLRFITSNSPLLFKLHELYAGKQSERFPAFDTPLKLASRFGLVSIVQRLLPGLKATSDFSSALGEALDLAAGYNHTDVAELLLLEGAPCVNALCLASKNGFFDIVKSLVEKRPDVINNKDDEGRSPFLLAALNGNETIGAYLLDHGAKVVVDDTLRNKSTVLHVAARTGQSKVLKLIDSSFDLEAVDQWGNDALLLAAEGGFDDVVQTLLKYDVSTSRQNFEGFTALHRAVALGQVSTCSVLLGYKGVDIQAKSKTGFSPVHLAASGGHLRILKLLLEGLGADYIGRKAEDSDCQPFEHGGDQESPYSPDGEARPPLELSAMRGHLDTLKELLKYPRYNSELTKATALMLAASWGWDTVVEELLSNANISVTVHDKNGFNALHLAAKFHHPHVLTQILDSPNSKSLLTVDSAAKNQEGWTPLHVAAEGGRFLTVCELLKRKADPRAVAGDGTTPLHIAAASGHAIIVDELLKALQHMHLDNDKHPLYLEDFTKRTPFIRAVEKGHKDVAVAIEKFVWRMQTTTPEVPTPPITDITKLQGQQDALYLAVGSQNEELVDYLTRGGRWDPNAANADRPNGLHLAASSAFANKTSSMLKILLEAGADPNVEYPTVDDEDAPRPGDRPLHIAVRDQRQDAIKTLLKRRANINAANEQGITPLYLAAYLGRSYEIQELLQWKPNLNARKTDSGWTALHAAYDNPDITRLLLDHRADPYALNKDNRPPFFLSADENNGEEILRVYLDHPNAKIDPNWRMKGGWPVLHTAASGGTVQTLKLLVGRGADINAADEAFLITPIHTALAEGRMDAIEFLLNQEGADLNADSLTHGTMLMAAAGRDDEGESVRLVIEKGVDVNAVSRHNDHYTALQRAAYTGDEEAVEALLDAGADVNLVGGKAFGSPLLAGIMSRSRERRTRVTKLLLDAGAEVNYAGSGNGTALEWALSHGRQGIVGLLLEKERKADVNIISKNERLGTPLIAAVDAGDVDSIEKLFARSADPNLSRAGDTETPAQVAVRRGRLNVLETLMKNGADLGYQGPLRRRILSHAIGWKSTDLLDLLWDRPEVDINEQDAELQTPLIIASHEGGLSVVEKLIRRGVNVDTQDRLGRTALMHATCKDYGSIVTALIDNGKTDLRIKDKRGRDALYWAARASGTDVFNKILRSTEGDGVASSYESAVMAAIASNRRELVETLLKRIQRLTATDGCGWTALYTAKMYQHEWIDMVEDVTPAGIEPEPKLPTQWDQDPILGVSIEEGGRALTIGRLAEFSLALAPSSAEYFRSVRGAVRANHAMAPVQDGVYYFEVQFTGVSDVGEIGVGFCEEHAETDAMLGHKEAGWGYHGDDGCIFGVDHRSGSGLPYGPKYGDGDVIGCGVNFDKGTVFYTKNGTIIGRAFTNIAGKLFPAVSMNRRMTGCRVSATFWDSEGQGKPFKFKGDFADPLTFEESEIMKKAVKRSETFGRDGRPNFLRRKHSSSDEDFEDSVSYESGDDESSD
ncbi:ankyrin repeat-containing domain protein [Cercophora newfieldiana]|uniref:Ankyrin repeat-containing domain protein n=1 Tax=Cercophora newfieldiana TaxID=92897 RepID=A0AA40CT92_9PEZI|nr:ankyrin repeat-containing domain protein [Cercophora newfieldiana]